MGGAGIRWFPRLHDCVIYYIDRLPEFMWGILDMPVSMSEGVDYYKDSIWRPIGFEPGSNSPWRRLAFEHRRPRPSVWGCSVIAVWRTGVGQ